MYSKHVWQTLLDIHSFFVYLKKVIEASQIYCCCIEASQLSVVVFIMWYYMLPWLLFNRKSMRSRLDWIVIKAQAVCQVQISLATINGQAKQVKRASPPEYLVLMLITELCFFHENMVNFLVPVFYSKRNLFFPFLSNSDFCFCCDLFLGASGSFSGADLSQLKDGMVRVTGKVRFQAKWWHLIWFRELNTIKNSIIIHSAWHISFHSMIISGYHYWPSVG